MCNYLCTCYSLLLCFQVCIDSIKVNGIIFPVHKLIFDTNEATMHINDGIYRIICNVQICGRFVWNNFVVQLDFLTECSVKNIQVIITSFSPALNEVQPVVHIVSAVYKFDCNVELFDKPFTLHNKHCVKLQSSEDCHKMWFISQNGVSIDVERGNFKIGNYYGTIYLNRFCTIYTCWSQKRLYHGAPVFITLPTNQNSKSYCAKAASNQPSSSSENAPNTSHNSRELSGSQHHNSLKSSGDISSDTETEHKNAFLPLHYKWMLALPKDHSKLLRWRAIFAVYPDLEDWKRVSTPFYICMWIHTSVHAYIW